MKIDGHRVSPACVLVKRMFGSIDYLAGLRAMSQNMPSLSRFLATAAPSLSAALSPAIHGTAAAAM